MNTTQPIPCTECGSANTQAEWITAVSVIQTDGTWKLSGINNKMPDLIRCLDCGYRVDAQYRWGPVQAQAFRGWTDKVPTDLAAVLS